MQVESLEDGVDDSVHALDVYKAHHGTGSAPHASDGTILGTFSAGTDIHSLLFDGAHIWVTNKSGNSVTKLRANDRSVTPAKG